MAKPPHFIIHKDRSSKPGVFGGRLSRQIIYPLKISADWGWVFGGDIINPGRRHPGNSHGQESDVCDPLISHMLVRSGMCPASRPGLTVYSTSRRGCRHDKTSDPSKARSEPLGGGGRLERPAARAALHSPTREARGDGWRVTRKRTASTPVTFHPSPCFFARFVGEERSEGRDDRNKSGIYEVPDHVLDVLVSGRRFLVEQLAQLRELHPQPSRRQRDALLIELRVRNGGRCW
jgi:hypothetical protein